MKNFDKIIKVRILFIITLYTHGYFSAFNFSLAYVLAPQWDGKINNEKGHVLYYFESYIESSKLSFL